MREILNRSIAAFSTALVTVAGVGIAALPAQARIVTEESHGYFWPDAREEPNWEGTYRLPATLGGMEAWAAPATLRNPASAFVWSAPKVLTYSNGHPIEQDKMERLAYIVSYGSDMVNTQPSPKADTVAAAVSIIINSWITHPTSTISYNPSLPLEAFDQGLDPLANGQNPRDVRRQYDDILAQSEIYRGPWSISLSSRTPEVQIGDTVTVSGMLLGRDGIPISNHEVDLVITGGALSSDRVVTNAQGEFSAVVSVSNATVAVTASRNAPSTNLLMIAPTAWNKGETPPRMLLVSDHKVSASVQITGTSISLGTSATDQSDGDKTISWTGGTVIDAVKYTDLSPGNVYTVKGELMDKETGEGTGIFGETTFTAEERDGTIAVEFVVPAGHAGSTLVVFEKLYDAEGEFVASHEDIEDEEQTVVVEDAPTLGTKATDQADGDKFLHWNGGTITDQVTYTGLIIGDEYTVTGELMDKETSEGTGIFGETTFTAEERDGTIAVEFVVPAGHAGSTLVVFEKLYNVDGKIVASHEDIEDEEQTVKVNEQPTLKTKASDQADGDKVIAWNGGTVVDHVTYTGLTIGQKYTVTGELMDKATGKGTGIKGQTTFTAESVDGTVKVTFKVPKGYAGKTLVAFERLYDAGGVLQAVHEDISDKEQTVTVEKQPVGPDLAKTGADDALFYALGAATLLGLGGALQLARNRRLKA